MMGVRRARLLAQASAPKLIAIARADQRRVLAVSSPDLDLGVALTSARSRRLIPWGQPEGMAVWTFSRGESVAFIFIVVALVAILMS
jgi:hypothetical protein